jgi:Flp pilus assembly protein TadG
MRRLPSSSGHAPVRCDAEGAAPASSRGQLLRRATDLMRCRRGVTALESALVFPFFFALLFGIEEVGRLLWMQNSLQYAVEAAARCAAINTAVCGTASTTQTFAANAALPAVVPTTAFTLSTATCGSQVTASYAFQSVAAPLVPLSVTLTAQSCYP